MIFSTPTFFLFFAIYLALHFLIPPRHRITLILVASIIFYGYYRPDYIWIPLLLTCIAYVGSISINKAQTQKARKLRLIFTISLLCLPLIFYKYIDFLYLSFIAIFSKEKQSLFSLPLPLGISFITFTLIAYLADVYKNRFSAEPNLKILSAYVLFFPQLIAGPILKPAQLIPQLKTPRPALSGRFILGTTIFTVGLVKKLVFADTIAPIVDSIYSAAPETLHLTDYLMAIYGFAMQIYCDFSGYTDMALGLGFILGVKLPKNFIQPYMAISLVDFWKRWHITLSTWLRDYIYIPLGGSRHGFQLQVQSVLITMFIGGLWHGANWTFVIWGLLHAIGIILWHGGKKLAWSRRIESLPRGFRILVTLHIVLILWVFFRSPDFMTALKMLSGPFTTVSKNPLYFDMKNAFPLFLLILFYSTHWLDDYRRLHIFIRKLPQALLYMIIIFLWTLTMVLSGGSSGNFIYFDF